ncbi:MAG: hypothetical protein AAF478_13670 [Pseudomonadota bacterium]
MAKCPSPCNDNCEGACYVNTKECTCWSEIHNLDDLLAPLKNGGGEIRIYTDSPGAKWLEEDKPSWITIEKILVDDKDTLSIRA